MKPVFSRPKEQRQQDWDRDNRSIIWKKEPRYLKSEVKFIDLNKDASNNDSFYPVPPCCQCSSRQLNFGGFLPVPRDEANFPYWVPRSLRPQKLVRRKFQSCYPKSPRTCTCACHTFGGQLPVPRDLATFPYWVPRSVRFPGKTHKTTSDFIWTKSCISGGFRIFYHQWRICCNEERLRRWQMIQAQLQVTAPQTQEEEQEQEQESNGLFFLSPGLVIGSFYGLVMIVISVFRFFFRC
ncbi:uncharacterized protein C16orf95 homolog isoform X2 [Antechinus flavipes]|uniref:uncharacterized protein C16orf95 homolog isoform X1 n=1 Tax=Antechinus flavipes TaxID=38775 RepID=UPI0022354EB3|nr:uncharacterized protein C16orf95 homolog isoform X1 [Antechinus flavipes]XP_051830788.1 uncharacterized protein C16orf95 homolog isoform X2 [Antechinus flavipes]